MASCSKSYYIVWYLYKKSWALHCLTTHTVFPHFLDYKTHFFFIFQNFWNWFLSYNWKSQKENVKNLGLLYVLYCVRRAVVQLLESLRYKPQGRGFDSGWIIGMVTLWLWHRGRLSPKWVPGIPPGGKGGRCLRPPPLDINFVPWFSPQICLKYCSCKKY